MPLPYARSEVDADGYSVVCPVCGERCRPPAGAADEDAVTKGANATYAAHYAEAHEADHGVSRQGVVAAHDRHHSAEVGP